MLPYWLLFTLFSVGAVQANRNREHASIRARRSAPILALAGLMTAVLIGFRYEVGADWATYLDIYETISHLSLLEALTFEASDPGFSLLNWISVGLGLEIWFVNFASAAIFSWGLIRFARVQPNPWLALVVAAPYLITVVAMGYTRQAVAIGIVLAGLARIGHAPIYQFALYVIVATLFHKSAVIVLPLVALASSRNRWVIALMMGIIAVVLFFFFIDAAYERMMSNYVDAEYSSQGAAIRVGMNLPAAILFMMFMKRFAEAEEERKVWRNMSLAALAALALLVLSSASTAVDRSALYVIPLQIYVLSRLPIAFGKAGRPDAFLVFLVIAYSATILYVWLNFATHAEYWLPYKSYPMFESSPY